jgi:hypothetical protein
MKSRRLLKAVFFGLLALGFSPSAVWAQKLVPAYQVQVYVTNTPHLGSSSTTLQQLVENTIDPMLGRSDDITDHFTTNAGNTELTCDVGLRMNGNTIVSNGALYTVSRSGQVNFAVTTNESGVIGGFQGPSGSSMELTSHMYAYNGFGLSGADAGQRIYQSSTDLILGSGPTASSLSPYLEIDGGPGADNITAVCDQFVVKDVNTIATNPVLLASATEVTVTNAPFVLRQSLLRATQIDILGISSVGATTLSNSLTKIQSVGTTADTTVTNTLVTPATLYGAGASVQIQVYGSTNIVWTNSATFHAGPSFTNLPGGISVSTSDLLMLQSTSNKWVVANFTDVP